VAETRAEEELAYALDVVSSETKENRRTGDGTGVLITTSSACGLVGGDGYGQILLVLQNLGLDALKCLCCGDTYRMGESMYMGNVLMRKKR
jgi:hypothetical protein